MSVIFRAIIASVGTTRGHGIITVVVVVATFFDILFLGKIFKVNVAQIVTF